MYGKIVFSYFHPALHLLLDDFPIYPLWCNIHANCGRVLFINDHHRRGGGGGPRSRELMQLPDIGVGVLPRRPLSPGQAGVMRRT